MYPNTVQNQVPDLIQGHNTKICSLHLHHFSTIEPSSSDRLSLYVYRSALWPWHRTTGTTGRTCVLDGSSEQQWRISSIGSTTPRFQARVPASPWCSRSHGSSHHSTVACPTAGILSPRMSAPSSGLWELTGVSGTAATAIQRGGKRSRGRVALRGPTKQATPCMLFRCRSRGCGVETVGVNVAAADCNSGPMH